MIRATAAQAEEILFRKLLFCQDFVEQSGAELGIPEVPWSTTSDNASDTTIGLSIVDAILRADEDKSRDWLFRKVWKDGRLRARFFPEADAGSTDPSTQAAYGYGQDVEKFLVVLLFLVHLSYGQPARAPELLTVRHRNTADGGVRNIMMDRGLVMIVT
ncbi:hypothetical protein LZ31DRAFT_486259, partial [Colletotrichum somersetense]